ncbi:MAG: cell wall-binding repeat-containing protein [Peptococcaceae bacterium]|nr:cell wall-binding repeat-containing protein [Peptococcaceae bacterium]
MQDLKYNSSYTVTISGTAGVNVAGQGFGANPYSLSFSTGQEFERLGGQDRYETAVKISRQGWQQSNFAVLATGKDFPDALSAAPLAKKYSAPILLTSPDSLPAQTETELERLQVRNVFIIGGYGAVSSAIEEKLQAKGIQTARLQGTDRYATSVAIANYLGPVSGVFVVTGSSFPDALSIASYAAQYQFPILLTPRDSLPSELNDFIHQHRITKSYVVGGEYAISEDVAQHFVNRERIAGGNRYQTNLAVLEKFGFDFSQTFIATGANFPDALAGSALAGEGNNPLLLVSNSMDEEVVYTLQANKDIMKMKYILGGEEVVPGSLLNRIFSS